MRHLMIATLSILIITGCGANTGTRAAATSVKQKVNKTTTATYEPIKNSSQIEFPSIEEVGNSRWGAKYTIFVSPQWDNPIVFEIVPTGNGHVEKVRVPASGEGSFSITAKTNPSRVVITYQGEDGVRRRLCTMRGLEVFMNLERTGFGLDNISCEFMKTFFLSDIEKNVAAQ